MNNSDDSILFTHQLADETSRGKRRKPPEETGEEAAYLRNAVDSKQEFKVVLRDGEELVGRIRYYDRNLFSLQQSSNGLNTLVRKDDVVSIQELDAAS